MSSPLGAQPLPPFLQGISAALSGAWASWMSTAQKILQAVSSSGPTTGRPTTALYLGQMYFDTTLGLAVWVKSIGPPVVWVNGAGASV